MTDEVKTHQIAAQHQLYETGDRAGKLLAWLGHKEIESRWVLSIKEQEVVHTTPENIAGAFERYYKALYEARTQAGDSQIRQYLQRIDMPNLTPDKRDSLEGDLILAEVTDAIGPQKAGKTPGPNGLPSEFFKMNTALLAPHLLKMFLESKEQGCLPQDLRLATVVVIHKEGKPPEDCGSYRPISLLNLETKILATILAHRLLNVILPLVHKDQSGFMPKRVTRLKLRRLAN